EALGDAAGLGDVVRGDGLVALLLGHEGHRVQGVTACSGKFHVSLTPASRPAVLQQVHDVTTKYTTPTCRRPPAACRDLLGKVRGAFRREVPSAPGRHGAGPVRGVPPGPRARGGAGWEALDRFCKNHYTHSAFHGNAFFADPNIDLLIS